MPDAQGFSYAHWTAVNPAGYTLLLAGENTNDVASAYFPSKGTISHVEVEFRVIAGATAASVIGTWDTAGNFVALPVTTASITSGPLDATKGAVVLSSSQIQFKQGADATKKQFGVWVRLDAGAAEARVRVYWRR
jgi:hypothetical protein